MSVHCWGKYGALLLSSGKIEGGGKLPYMAVPRTWSSARFTPLTAAAAPSCGHVWRSETGQTGSKRNRESRVSSAPRWGRLLTQLAFWAGERKRKKERKSAKRLKFRGPSLPRTCFEKKWAELEMEPGLPVAVGPRKYLFASSWSRFLSQFSECTLLLCILSSRGNLLRPKMSNLIDIY